MLKFTRDFFVFVCASSAFLSCTQAVAASVTVPDAGFELAAAQSPWRFYQHAGVKAYKVLRDKEFVSEGKQSLRITRIEEQFFGAMSQFITDLSPGKYRLIAKLKTSETIGKGWSLFVRIPSVAGSGSVFSGARVIGTTDWSDSAVEFVVPAGASGVEIGLSLESAGTGWADDVRIEQLSAP